MLRPRHLDLGEQILMPFQRDRRREAKRRVVTRIGHFKVRMRRNWCDSKKEGSFVTLCDCVVQ